MHKNGLSVRTKHVHWLVILVSVALGACATYAPVRFDDPSAISSFQSRTTGDVTVSVAILTDEQARKHFGPILARTEYTRCG